MAATTPIFPLKLVPPHLPLVVVAVEEVAAVPALLPQLGLARILIDRQILLESTIQTTPNR